MLPGEWHKRLVDMNITGLSKDDIRWADYVFIGAAAFQQQSVKEIVNLCLNLQTKIVAGGPLFTTDWASFDGIEHFILDEAEVTLPLFLQDLEKGRTRHIYTSKVRPDISHTPVPLWSLINLNDYSSMNVQYSRGCPFNCEFCDIVLLNGHKPRTKETHQLLAEFDELYRLGWRGSVFIVDDNFIGNKKKLKQEVLPAIIDWRKGKKHPFSLSTEASINLADDERLMGLMVDAGFGTVFIGIETPNEESLAECTKNQNRNRDLADSVRKIQNEGLEVQGGFIVGFDSDPITIFKNQISFIQKSGIVTAMVGLLNAPLGTRLYKRLKMENRLTQNFTGDNTDGSLNFIPKMNYETLVNGYKSILSTIYSNRHFYRRISAFLKEYRPKTKTAGKLQKHHVKALFKSIWYLGIKEKGRRYYWKLFFSTLLKQPRKFPISITLSVYGYHFRKVVEDYLNQSVSAQKAVRL